ncbi:hypothetical protein AGMMS50262_14410 [Bacteroidia bacterium]|nr:hypothetical protein AGMMS50262_14410 [Bacteroidia bacterium]
MIEKRLPVVINGTFSPATGCILADSLHIDPAVVWVYGDKNIVDTLQAIETVPVNQKNIRKKIDVTLRLVAPPHIRLSDDKVKITAEVEEYTEKLFELPVVCRRMPDNVHVRFFPSTVEVSCQVALKKYAELTDDDLEVSVDYRTLTQKQSINASLSLSKKPKGLVNYRIQPETVEFLIEQKKGL